MIFSKSEGCEKKLLFRSVKNSASNMSSLTESGKSFAQANPSVTPPSSFEEFVLAVFVQVVLYAQVRHMSLFASSPVKSESYFFDNLTTISNS